MKKVAIFGLILINISFAKSLVATQACEAFNNLRHSKNSGNISLRVGQEYEILEQRDNDYFIRVPYAHPQNRWVDKSCFNSFNRSTSSSKRVDLDSILVLSWQNTFCSTHSFRKECRAGIGKDRLVLHGLWPQPRSNEYCNIDKKIVYLDKNKRWNALPKLNLDSNIVELMKEYMPGYFSNLQRHEYFKHGSCYSNNPNEYFKDALVLTKEADNTLGEFLRDNIGRNISFVTLQRYAVKTISPYIKYKLSMHCKDGKLNEIWISIKGKGSYLEDLVKDAKRIRTKCLNAYVTPSKGGKIKSFINKFFK